VIRRWRGVVSGTFEDVRKIGRDLWWRRSSSVHFYSKRLKKPNELVKK
jgi:hypothetical protein